MTKIFYKIADIQAYLLQFSYKQVGFVPTMGALHAGHESLILASKKQNDLTICSIYVNPTQFNNPEDLKKYPRTLPEDIEKLEKIACDIIFIPSNEEIYPKNPSLTFNFGNLESVMEGKFRQGHFNGVATVVSKLFHIIKPNRTYFGQKDLQQTQIISLLIKDLSFGIELICCPTLREKDGLAMSSRNLRLNPQHRNIAPRIYQAMLLAQELVFSQKDINFAKKQAIDFLSQEINFVLDYFEIVDCQTLGEINEQTEEIAICVAAFLGGVRLIDNLLIKR